MFSAAAIAASFMLSNLLSSPKDPRGHRIGSKTRQRVRRSVESVYHEIGEVLFRRAYRMTYQSFLELYRLLEPELLRIHKEIQKETVARRRKRSKSRGRSPSKTWKRHVPNGVITTSTVRLAIALRFFAGGDLYDVAPSRPG